MLSYGSEIMALTKVNEKRIQIFEREIKKKKKKYFVLFMMMIVGVFDILMKYAHFTESRYRNRDKNRPLEMGQAYDQKK